MEVGFCVGLGVAAGAEGLALGAAEGAWEGVSSAGGVVSGRAAGLSVGRTGDGDASGEAEGDSTTGAELSGAGSLLLPQPASRLRDSVPARARARKRRFVWVRSFICFVVLALLDGRGRKKVPQIRKKRGPASPRERPALQGLSFTPA